MKKIIWKKLWARKYAPFMSEAFIKTFQSRPGYDMCANKLFLPEGGLYAIYLAQNEFDSLVKNFTEFLLSQNLKNYAELYEGHFRELLSWARRVSAMDCAKLDNKKMKNLLKECALKLSKSGEWQMLSFAVLEGPGRELENTLSDGKNGGKILEWITTPYRLTKMAKMRLELLEVLLKGRPTDEEISAYAKKYAWAPVYEFIDKPWSVEDIKNQIATVGDPTAEIENYKKTRDENLKNYRQYFDSLPNGRLKKLVEIVHYFSYLKEMRDDYRRRAYYFLRPFWMEIAKRTKLEFEETNHLLADELAAALDNPSREYKNIAGKRMKKYSLVLSGGKLSIYDYDVSAKYLGALAGSNGANEIVGVSANRGRARGRVSVIFHQGEFGKFKDGDILVTAMTHPEFIAIMKRAVAIVTDEGGLTCHAAIVARELGIPCVIGTKIATKTLKDGQIVEVDADEGIVKIR